MKCKYNTGGFALIEVMIALFVLAAILGPLLSVLVTAHHKTAFAQDDMEILMAAQAQMEELLASDLTAWMSKPFQPVPGYSAYEHAVKVKRLPVGLYKIQIFIQRRDPSHSQTFELATLATVTGRIEP